MKDPKTQTVKKQILKAEKLLLSAMKISDVYLLDQLLHDDLLFLTPDGQTITKAMDLDAHQSGNMVIDQISAVVNQVQIIEDIAISTVTTETKGKMFNQPIEGTFKYIRIWKLFGSDWKVIGGSCMKI